MIPKLSDYLLTDKKLEKIREKQEIFQSRPIRCGVNID
jgi:hypothetical protein